MRRRFAPHQPRYAHAARWLANAADRHPAPAQAQQARDHLDLSPGIDNAEIIDTVHTRRAPMAQVSTALRP
jgi:hypothetical protein